MDIQPASLAMVRESRDGKRTLITEDVLDVARRLKEIDPRLALQWNEKGDFYSVYEETPDGGERLVTTSADLDPRLIERVQEIAHPSYDYGAELDRRDRAADRAKDHVFHERVGEIGERAAHALRKDLQDKHRVYVPKDVRG